MTEFAQPIGNMKYIIPVDEFDLANLIISTRRESVNEKKLLWSCNPKTYQEIEFVIGSDSNQDNLNTGVTNKNYEVCTKMKSEKMNMNMYLRIVSSLSDFQQSVKELDNQQIEVTTVNGKILKVPSDNFLGLSEVRGHIQCRVCRELVTDREAHLMTIKHLNMLATPIMDENCVRQMDAIWSYCVICNTIIGDASFHVQCNVEHQDLVKQAMQQDHTTVTETVNHTGDYQLFILENIPSGSIHKTNDNKHSGSVHKTNENKPGSTNKTNENKPGSVNKTNENKPGSVIKTNENKPGSVNKTNENKPSGIDYKINENKASSTKNKNVNKPTGSTQKSNENQPGSIHKTNQNNNEINTKTKNDPNNLKDVLESCADKHALYCKVCDTFVPNSNYNITTHVRGYRHNSNLYVYDKSECETDKKLTNIELKPSTSKIFYCSLCEIEMHVKDQLSHLKGFYHKKSLKNKQIADARIELLNKESNKESLPEKIDFFYYCQICDRKMQMKDKESHLNGNSHNIFAKRQQRPEKIQATNNNFESNLETNKIHQLNIVTNKKHELNIGTNKNHELNVATNKNIELNIVTNKNNELNVATNEKIELYIASNADIGTNKNSNAETQNDLSTKSNIIIKPKSIGNIDKIYKNDDIPIHFYCEPCNLEMHIIAKQRHLNSISHYQNVNKNLSVMKNPSENQVHTVKQTNSVKEIPNNNVTSIVKKTANNNQKSIVRESVNNSQTNIVKENANNIETNFMTEIAHNSQTNIVKTEPYNNKTKIVKEGLNNNQTSIIKESANNNQNSIVNCSANNSQTKIFKEITRDNQTTIVKKEPDNNQTCIIKESANNNQNSIDNCSANYSQTKIVKEITRDNQTNIVKKESDTNQTYIIKETANYYRSNTIIGANNNEKEPIKLKNIVNNHQTETIKSRNIVQEITRDNQTTIVKKEPDNNQTCIIKESANNNQNSIVNYDANYSQTKIVKEITRDNQTTIVKKEPDNNQTCIIKETANYCQRNAIKGANNNEKEPIKLNNIVNNNQTETVQSRNKVKTEQPNLNQTNTLRNGEYANIENNKRFSQDRVETKYRTKSVQNNIICQKRQNSIKKIQCCVIL